MNEPIKSALREALDRLMSDPAAVRKRTHRHVCIDRDVAYEAFDKAIGQHFKESIEPPHLSALRELHEMGLIAVEYAKTPPYQIHYTKQVRFGDKLKRCVVAIIN